MSALCGAVWLAVAGLELAIADLGIPRAEPCSALTGAVSMCGATPSSLYHRTCGVVSHGSDIWLCPVHAAIVATGAASCRDCLQRGGIVQARIYRIVVDACPDTSEVPVTGLFATSSPLAPWPLPAPEPSGAVAGRNRRLRALYGQRSGF